MGKTTYKLSPQYELIEDTIYLAKHGYNSTALLNKESGAVLLLNAVITTFLKAFQYPTTLNAVVNLFQKDTNDTIKDIKSALNPFFKSMSDRGIIEPCEDAVLPSKPEMPNGEGVRLGNYTLEKRLTCKPPIDIYIAKNDEGQKFLIKRLLFEPSFPEKYRSKTRRTFAEEFKILKILRGCPNICPLILFDKKNDYAVIQFFAGDTLKTLVKQKTIFSISEQLFIIKQMLETAAFIHQKGILHGDWHYKNVLINDNNIVKVIDFDLAFEDEKREKRHISRGGIKEFIPPERIDDSAFGVVTTPPDFRAEVFQIGVLVYYLCFGDYPFKGETWKKLAKSIQNAPPNWPETGVPATLIDLLKRALAKQPEARFESAVAMQKAFLDIENT